MGQRLQRIRLEKGFSQSELARRVGVPASSLKNWEQDRRSLSLDTAVRLAVALGVTVDELAGLTGQPAKRPRKADK